MQPLEPVPVKYFCAILFAAEDPCDSALEALTKLFGEIDYHSPALSFDITDYYATEMGAEIFRKFVSFKELRDPGELAALKRRSNAIEDQLAMGGKRRVNLDIGYLDYDKLVLASAKYNGHKIYLGQGIYADPTLHYRKGGYHPYPTAFPDFQDGRYDQFLLEIRRLYKLGVRG